MLGLDLGRRRIGVAITDDGRRLATPYRTLQRIGDQPVEHAEIVDVVAETEAVLVVVGLPRSLDGSDGPAARQARTEIRKLRNRLAVPVVEHDERFTTVTAERSLRFQGIHGRDRRAVVDQVAAAVLLQDWLDARADPAAGASQADTRLTE